ncbi:hypothetical protein O982_23810 [Mycobacterium avium 10-5581]|nr:hypothetical protein O982_23810 [Mycobacterium avium 10-5581]
MLAGYVEVAGQCAGLVDAQSCGGFLLGCAAGVEKHGLSAFLGTVGPLSTGEVIG